jgi:hypothetical protein
MTVLLGLSTATWASSPGTLATDCQQHQDPVMQDSAVSMTALFNIKIENPFHVEKSNQSIS